MTPATFTSYMGGFFVLCFVALVISVFGIVGFDAAVSTPDFERMERATVRVEITSPAIDGRYVGSGFIAAPNTVVTAAHIAIPGASRYATVRVTFSGGETRTGRVLGIPPPNGDNQPDLAVLYVDVPEGYAPAEISCARPDLGDEIAVVGYPAGHERSVMTWGRVGSERSKLSDLAGYLVTLDATVTPGNSGGPVFNADGEVTAVVVMMPVYPREVEYRNSGNPDLPRIAPSRVRQLMPYVFAIPGTTVCTVLGR